MLDRLRRVTDLFVEGTEYHAGDDENGPVVLWINKLNSFQAAEAQKDAIARRYIAIAALKNSGEYDGFVAETEMTPIDRLAQDWVDMSFTEIYMEAANEIDLDSELKEQREALERVEGLQDDAGAVEDSAEREQTIEIKRTWIGRFQELQAAKAAEWLRDAKAMPAEDLRAKIHEKWRELRTHSEYDREHRATQLFFAIRHCSARRVDDKWDHTGCDHSKQWLADRSEVHGLPEELLTALQERLESITVPARAAGNSDAPASSSESSEPSSAPEEASKPSSPGETPSAAQ